MSYHERSGAGLVAVDYDFGPVRPLSGWEARRGGLWAAGEVQRAMPDAPPEEQHAAVTELLDCLGITGHP